MEINIKHKLLLVDDDNVFVNCFMAIMGHDLEVQVVDCGIDAVEAIKHLADIDLVVLDDKLPDISGLDVLRQIKALKPHVPVILTTSCGSEELAVQSFRNGAGDYINKPIDFTELRRIILALVPGRNTSAAEKNKGIAYHDCRMKKEVDDIEINNRYSNKMQKALSFIDDHHRTKIRLGTVANYAGMSMYHFSKIFKKIMGITYQDYLNNVRIETAMVLLKMNYSITDVTFEVGYEDITHFGKTFKKIVGCPPSKYLKTLSAD